MTSWNYVRATSLGGGKRDENGARCDGSLAPLNSYFFGLKNPGNS